MRIVIALSLLLVLLASSAEAQTAIPGSSLGWDQAADSAAEAGALLYEAAFDGLAPVALSGVVCTGTVSPFQCAAPLVGLRNGAHMVAVRAVAVVDGTRLESPLSAVFNFLWVAVPNAPSNLRIVPPGE